MTINAIIEDLYNNIYNYDETAQLIDIKLICKLLRYKYNNDELLSISQKLICEIEKRNSNSVLWFAND